MNEPDTELGVCTNLLPNPPREADDDALLADMLEDLGVLVTPERLVRVDETVDRLAFRRAGEALRHMAGRLGNTAAGWALRRELLGEDAETVRAAAKRLGVSHVALLKHQQRVKRALAS